MQSIQDKLLQAGNRPSGFDYLRLLLSTGVILQHTVNVSYGGKGAEDLFHSPAIVPCVLILPMFFALSGFLVAGSLERNKSLFSFVGLRALRLLPALSFEITLSALILGPSFTVDSLGEYFSSESFRSYFLNIIGDIHYVLPGVFLENPVSNIVNGQLWTIPIELQCYLILSLLAVFGITSRKKFIPWLVVGTCLAMILFLTYRVMLKDPPHQVPVYRSILVGCFLCGICLYRKKESILFDARIAAFSLILAVILVTIVPYGEFFLPLPATYLTVYLGCLNPRKVRLLRSGDYSYGLFLYGFPIQQAVATQAWTHDWWKNFLIAYPITFLFAFVSWWAVEKPAMRLKSLVVRVESRILALEPFGWHSRSVFAVRDSEN